MDIWLTHHWLWFSQVTNERVMEQLLYTVVMMKPTVRSCLSEITSIIFEIYPRVEAM